MYILFWGYDIINMVKVVNNKIKIVLEKIINNGYTAFVVGGFIRDYLLGRESYDVDISTSAEPKDIRDIFDLNNASDDNYGSVFIKDKLYNYDITTFRKELKYVNRKPVEYQFIDSITEDIQRRDFTINALYMDIEGNIHDEVEGRQDLDDKIIRVVGNIEEKMIEDPLRMLRAIRFASTLDFKLESNLETYIKQNKQLIKTLSYNRRKEELEKIFKSQNYLSGIDLIKRLNLCDVLELKIDYPIRETMNPLGIWAQIEFSDNYPFTNTEKENIDIIKKIINYGIIDNIVLYEYGLYNSIIAGEILGFNRSYISDIYKNLPIYSVKDIQINGDDIIEILNIDPSSKVKDIIHDIEISILNNILENKYEVLKTYILDNWR